MDGISSLWIVSAKTDPRASTPHHFTPKMARRICQTRMRQRQNQIRLASITVLRGFVSRSSWIQDLNQTFNRLHRQDRRYTFADALRAYADELEGV
jgi:hypothetical protein